jgi:hypothetical protein
MSRLRAPVRQTRFCAARLITARASARGLVINQWATDGGRRFINEQRQVPGRAPRARCRSDHGELHLNLRVLRWAARREAARTWLALRHSSLNCAKHQWSSLPLRLAISVRTPPKAMRAAAGATGIAAPVAGVVVVVPSTPPTDWLGVGVGVALGVGVGVGVALDVGVGVGVALDVGVGVGDGSAAHTTQKVPVFIPLPPCRI